MSLYQKRGIYAIHNKVTNSFYIGCTNNNFGDRRDVHYAMLRNGYHHNKTLQKEFNDYGEQSIEFIIIKEIDLEDSDVYYEYEKKYIAEFRKLNCCINETDGGIGGLGVRLSKERIKELSEINRKNMTGRKMSDETKAKMSETRVKNQFRMGGKNHSSLLDESDVKEIKMALMNGESCRNLSIRFNVSVQCISKINAGVNWKGVVVDGWEDYLKSRE